MVTERRRSRLPASIQAALITHFVAGVPARTAAELAGVNRHSATLFYHKLRELIAAKLATEAPFALGEIEVDESYFGGVRKGKRGRGAAGKVPVFGLLKRNGKAFDDDPRHPVANACWHLASSQSVVYTDSYRSYGPRCF